MSAAPSAQDTDALIYQEFLPFGKKFLHYPGLLRNNLSVRTAQRKFPKGWRIIPISQKFKSILLDIVFNKKFDKTKYDELESVEQAIFDRLLHFCGIQSHAIARGLFKSAVDREELLKQFEVLKGELLAGNDSKEIIKKMRSILIELRDKNFIPKGTFDKLMSDILLCI